MKSKIIIVIHGDWILEIGQEGDDLNLQARRKDGKTFAEVDPLGDRLAVQNDLERTLEIT